MKSFRVYLKKIDKNPYILLSDESPQKMTPSIYEGLIRHLINILKRKKEINNICVLMNKDMSLRLLRISYIFVIFYLSYDIQAAYSMT